jgi:DNA polymerase III delta prime subunit
MLRDKTKNLYIEIPHYEFNEKEDEKFFIGREEAIKNLKRRLRPSKEKNCFYKGSYLIAGYRGMGKTTLVEKAIKEIQKEKIKKNKILHIPIILSQKELSDYDLLRQIFIQFSEKIPLSRYKNTIVISRVIAFIFALIAPLAILYFTNTSLEDVKTNIEPFVKPFNNLSSPIQFFLIVIFTAIILSFSKSFDIFLRKVLFKHKINLVDKIEFIEKRVFSNLQISNVSKTNPSAGNTRENSITNNISNLLFSKKEDIYRQEFNQFTVKELEYEIKSLLKLYARSKKRRFSKYQNVLFTIDELDKLEPDYSSGENTYLDLGKSRLDNRKEALVSLLANLKSFINNSDAKFVFIGGAEMYEASLADISDRESFYSSIFQEVIYVQSFFKDFNEKEKGVTELVEKYVTHIIFPNTEEDLFQLLNNNTKKVLKDDLQKCWFITIIQLFIIYLSYRSNGSPKKLKELIEYFLVNNIKASKEDDVVFYLNEDGKYDFSFIDKKRERIFLEFTSRQQHKISVISLVFLPFLMNNDFFLKRLNDNNLYLFAFLMDHVLKFHKSAFSWRELELMPDIIIGSKGPNLRKILDSIIEYLSQIHIRETSNSIFTFKFRGRFAKELKYLSKVSDESAAAFNFTYDESYHLKSFFKRKLEQKKQSYSNDRDSNLTYRNTIGFLNSTIADIHYYDEEYDSAIRYYADAIQSLRNIKQNPDLHLSQHQNTIFIRTQLLLSLCLEKSKRYDSTYSLIRSIILDSFKIRPYEKLKQKENKGITTKTWEDPYRRLQLYLKPYLALLMIIEKDRIDGITQSNLNRNILEYCKFMSIVELFPVINFKKDYEQENFLTKGTRGDNKRIQTLLAYYYQNVGSILFFKNKIFSSLYEKGKSIFEYLCIKNSITYKEVIENNFYYPSFSSFFYYIISINHLFQPYLDNLRLLNSIAKEKDIIGDNYFEIIQKLSMRDNSDGILNGKQKEIFGQTIAKLSDSILGSLENNYLSKYISIGNSNISKLSKEPMEFWVSKSSNKKFDHKEFFSLNTIFYLNLISYNFYMNAGKYYDALFQLKKTLYILRVHFRNKNFPDFLKKYTTLLVDESSRIIKTHFSSLNSNKLFNMRLNPEFRTDLDLISIEEKEIEILQFHIEKKYDIGLQYATIGSIYVRIQFLRFKSQSYFALLNKVIKKGSKKGIKQCFEQVHFCFQNLIEKIKIYEVSYIMSNAYFGGVYYNIYKWILVLEKLDDDLKNKIGEFWTFKDKELIKNYAIDYFERSIRLHSEGKEYKELIKNMYLLEDDLNDSLIHFTAALERSLINTGILEAKLNKLN